MTALLSSPEIPRFNLLISVYIVEIEVSLHGISAVFRLSWRLWDIDSGSRCWLDDICCSWYNDVYWGNFSRGDSRCCWESGGSRGCWREIRELSRNLGWGWRRVGWQSSRDLRGSSHGLVFSCWCLRLIGNWGRLGKGRSFLFEGILPPCNIVRRSWSRSIWTWLIFSWHYLIFTFPIIYRLTIIFTTFIFGTRCRLRCRIRYNTIFFMLFACYAILADGIRVP